VANIINAQPLGLSEQQGQQLFNQVAEQVLQNMGSTAQLRNFNTPSGFDQRFNSFQPDQLLPPGVAPLGFANGNIQGSQNSAISNINLNGRENLSNGPSFLEQLLMGRQIAPQQQRIPIIRQNGFSQQNSVPIGGLSNSQFSNGRLSFQNSRLPFPDNRFETVHDISHFPDAIPVDPSSVHVTATDIRDPIGRALQANTRLRERLQALNVQDDKKLVIGAESIALEEIRRENRRLRKLIRQKKGKLNTHYDQVKKPPPPPPPKKNNKFGAGLLLGALGALIIG